MAAGGIKERTTRPVPGRYEKGEPHGWRGRRPHDSNLNELRPKFGGPISIRR